MLIKMVVGLSGPTITLSPGDEYDCGDDEALRLIESGAATPVSERKIERMVASPVMERRGKKAR